MFSRKPELNESSDDFSLIGSAELTMGEKKSIILLMLFSLIRDVSILSVKKLSKNRRQETSISSKWSLGGPLSSDSKIADAIRGMYGFMRESC
uniref:Uncharacterized protein n=1 Tax=Romanomermis culicivorax TaxID=13658 RepID=A0A915KKX8_ROMCU